MPAVKFPYQTSPYACDGPHGCGAPANEPCVIRPRPDRTPDLRAGQPRATMHHHRPRASAVEVPPELTRQMERLKGEVAAAQRDERERGVMRQPSPVANEHPPIVPQVIEDLTARAVAGKLKYGVALQPFNGRDPARDAYEEAQDMTLYLKAFVIERTAMVAELERLRAEVAELRARLGEA